ncbi:MAG: hypothetical protein K9L17_00715 [Clostridiales bacterium]|nr:hypothetical protein [Clostridiales bacterium]MCF8021214.1 hypothetical protein [Clostridiales bacterium]
MDKMPLISILLYSVPEAFLIFTFGMVILGRKLPLVRILTVALVAAFSSYFIRLLPFPFGIHALLGTILVFLLFIKILGLKVKQALLATLISMGFLLILENTVVYLLEIVLDLTIKEIWQRPLLRTFIGWPDLLIWAFITLILYKKKIHLPFRG